MKSVGGRRWSSWQRAVAGLAIGVLVVVSGFVWRAVTATVTVTPSWTYDIGYGTSAPAVADGVVYVLGGELGEDRMYALDAATGKQRWTRKLPRDPSGAGYSDPVVAAGAVYVTVYSRVYALDAATGEQRWTYDTRNRVRGDLSPAVTGNALYFGDETGRVYALDAATGEQRWTHDIGRGLYVRPVVADGVVYVGSARVYALDAATGEQRWISETSGLYVSVTPARGVVCVRTIEGDMYALDAATGEQRWAYEVSDGDYYPDNSVVADGVVYLDDGENMVHALDAATGEQRWTFETGSGIYRPVVADGVVYISTSSDKVHAVRAATG